jgi:excisionase family DNA binding protein
MATTSFRRYLKSKIKWLQDHEPVADEVDTLPYDAADICREARRRAVAAGLPDVAAVLATVRTEALALVTAQHVLAEALAALAVKPTSLTPPEVAKRLGVSPDAVRGWIRSGELKATNTADPKKSRPRFRIEPDAVKAFQERRAAKIAPAAPIRRRRREACKLTVTRY